MNNEILSYIIIHLCLLIKKRAPQILKNPFQSILDRLCLVLSYFSNPKLQQIPTPSSSSGQMKCPEQSSHLYCHIFPPQQVNGSLSSYFLLPSLWGSSQLLSISETSINKEDEKTIEMLKKKT